jgi:hypothetical protein
MAGPAWPTLPPEDRPWAPPRADPITRGRFGPWSRCITSPPVCCPLAATLLAFAVVAIWRRALPAAAADNPGDIPGAAGPSPPASVVPCTTSSTGSRRRAGSVISPPDGLAGTDFDSILLRVGHHGDHQRAAAPGPTSDEHSPRRPTADLLPDSSRRQRWNVLAGGRPSLTDRFDRPPRYRRCEVARTTRGHRPSPPSTTSGVGPARSFDGDLRPLAAVRRPGQTTPARRTEDRVLP